MGDSVKGETDFLRLAELLAPGLVRLPFADTEWHRLSLNVKRDAAGRTGVCSSCPEHVARFDAGEREYDPPARPPGELILPGDPAFHL